MRTHLRILGISAGADDWEGIKVASNSFIVVRQKTREAYEIGLERDSAEWYDRKLRLHQLSYVFGGEVMDGDEIK